MRQTCDCVACVEPLYCAEWGEGAHPLLSHIEQMRQKLIIYCCRRGLSVDDAEDLVQDAILRAHQTLPGAMRKWGNEFKIEAHLFNILRGMISDLRKKRATEARYYATLLRDTQTTKDNQDYEKLIVNALARQEFEGRFWSLAKECLDEAEYQILIYRYREERPWKEVAELLSISADAARQRDRQIRKKLAQSEALRQLCAEYGMCVDIGYNCREGVIEEEQP